jgi:hypothetical protein
MLALLRMLALLPLLALLRLLALLPLLALLRLLALLPLLALLRMLALLPLLALLRMLALLPLLALLRLLALLPLLALLRMLALLPLLALLRLLALLASLPLLALSPNVAWRHQNGFRPTDVRRSPGKASPTPPMPPAAPGPVRHFHPSLPRFQATSRPLPATALSACQHPRHSYQPAPRLVANVRR